MDIAMLMRGKRSEDLRRPYGFGRRLGLALWPSMGKESRWGSTWGWSNHYLSMFPLSKYLITVSYKVTSSSLFYRVHFRDIVQVYSVVI